MIDLHTTKQSQDQHITTDVPIHQMCMCVNTQFYRKNIICTYKCMSVGQWLFNGIDEGYSYSWFTQGHEPLATLCFLYK